MSERDQTVAEYVRFSREFARGVSDVYAELTEAAAKSAIVLDFLDDLPPPKRQPNLLLAALKYHFGVPAGIAAVEGHIIKDATALRKTMMSRATQTNEPARCAPLIPAFAQIDGPLALLEVGASAGLCLLPDKYAYSYGGQHLGVSPVTFDCVASDGTPVPDALPQVVWCRGMDLNPLDIRSDADVAWLEALIWPGQEARLKAFRKAVTIARETPPEVVVGDLLSDLASVVADAPSDATLVVFHTTVLMYIQRLEDRLRFADQVRDLGAVWISNEDADLFPDIAAKAPPPPGQGRLLLSVDREPVAWTQPHGQSVDWFGPASRPESDKIEASSA